MGNKDTEAGRFRTKATTGVPVFDVSGNVVAMVTASSGDEASDLGFAVLIDEPIPRFEMDAGVDLASLQEWIDRRRAELAEPYLVDALLFRKGQAEAGLPSSRRRAGDRLALRGSPCFKGELFLQQEHFEEAEQAYRRAVETNYESVNAWMIFHRFVLEHRSDANPQRLPDAMVALERALEIEP